MPSSSAPVSSRLPHLLFGLALALLALLGAWWFIFLARSVGTQEDLTVKALQRDAEVAALRLAATPVAPTPGPVPRDPRLEVVAAESAPDAPRIGETEYAVRATEQVKADLRRHFSRWKLMVRGEGALLLLLVLACVAMLYRLVLAEHRYRVDSDDFLGRVTHEMKTPLAGLKALLQTLREGRVPAERLPSLVEMGLRQAEREEHLIENLLTAHRLRTGGATLATAPVDVGAVLERFVAHRHHSMGEAQGQHVVACPPGLLAEANAGAMTTILENLADNAFKYGARRLAIDVEPTAEGVRIAVSDDGEGFDPTRAEDLFQRFRRDASERSAGRHGTGLGLHISRALAREMSGSLVAASEGPGRGARFTLTVPAAREPASHAVAGVLT